MSDTTISCDFAHNKVEIDTPGARFDISIVASGEIEIYSPDGSIIVNSQSSNTVRLQVFPFWDDVIATKIVQHMLDSDSTHSEKARKIVEVLRGRTNANKPKGR